MRRRPSLPSSSYSPSPTNNHQQLFHRRIVQVALLVHIGSVLACVTAVRLETGEPCSVLASPLQNEKANVSSFSSEKCFIWSAESPKELCRLDTTTRVQRLRSTFLFAKLQPISLYDIFSAGSHDRNIPARLRPGSQGADCLRASGARCGACFARLGASLRDLDEAYRSFDATLARFDCMPALDTASATRPFSPNGSCTTCRSWYRRWLLVQTLSLWRASPCVNWCYYAQLACPHLATSKVVDYAGHPSFQCRDLDIPSTSEAASRCECVHPCDLRGMVPTATQHASHDATRHAPHDMHDFYAADVHCRARQRFCSRTAHDRSTAHDRQPPRSGGARRLSAAVAASLAFVAVILSCQ